MLKNQLSASEYFRVLRAIRNLVRFALKEVAGDGLQWSDVQKFLKSDEFQAEVIDMLGGFGAEASGAPLTQTAPFDVSLGSLQAAQRLVAKLQEKHKSAGTVAA